LYVYLGTEPRVYMQYLDVTPDDDGEVSPRPLEVEPGHEYAMEPCPGWNADGPGALAVPPADGLWTGVTPRGEVLDLTRATNGNGGPKAAPAKKKGATE
jgi:hypothetical protein